MYVLIFSLHEVDVSHVQIVVDLVVDAEILLNALPSSPCTSTFFVVYSNPYWRLLHALCLCRSNMADDNFKLDLLDTMHISKKIAEAERQGKPIFSFEFFPPKTEQVNQYSGFIMLESLIISRVLRISMTVCLALPLRDPLVTLSYLFRYGPNA